MNELNLQNPPVITPRNPRWAPNAGFVDAPSFARALRQRGLITPIEAADADGSIAVLSVYEAHLRRRAMEQAFASLRDDRG